MKQDKEGVMTVRIVMEQDSLCPLNGLPVNEGKCKECPYFGTACVLPHKEAGE